MRDSLYDGKANPDGFWYVLVACPRKAFAMIVAARVEPWRKAGALDASD